MPLEITTSTAPSSKRALKVSLADRWAALQARKPGVQERMFFTEQLSLLLETGTAIYPALASLKAQIKNPTMLKVVGTLMEDISEGRTFAVALSRYPELFSATYVNLVAAAESGGFLDQVLLELMKLDDRREELRRTVISALTYPVFLIVFSFAVVVFVLMVVFPKFEDMFSTIRDQLPITTLLLMDASKLLTEHWMSIGLGTVAVLVGIGYWIKTSQGQRVLDQLKMRVFYFRDIFIEGYLIQSLRVLGLSMANGVSVMDALQSCREVVKNRIYQEFIAEVANKVKEGEGFAQAFQTAKFIPPTVRQMVTTGEETGNLPRVLARVADYYERELAKRLNTFSRLVEPIMLLLMGAIVGVIVSSLILPIFKLSRAVG
ncbi:MAG: type II secretion system F family protein [Gammaproteobacteria bacterium]